MKNYLLNLLLFQNNKFIKNSEYPVCKNCKFYKIDQTFPNDYLLGKCTLFGYQNIITGEINHNYADITRKENNLCTIKGIYFVKKD
jgi:hypothetical protein